MPPTMRKSQFSVLTDVQSAKGIPMRRSSLSLTSVLLAIVVMGAEGSSCSFTTDIAIEPTQATSGDTPGSEEPDEPDVGPGLGNTVTVSPPVVVLSRGERFTFSALVTPPPNAEGEQLTNKIAIWSIRQGTIGGSITQSNDL